MQGLMMQYPLTLRPMFDRAAQLFPHREIVSRMPDRSIRRTTYGEFAIRVQKLANALRRLGIRPGDRIATLGWNHGRHLEAYFAVPLSGAVLHTVNPRLSPADLAFIVNDAGDRIVLVDDVLLPVWQRFQQDCPHVEHVIVWSQADASPEGTIDYEALIANEPGTFDFPTVDENQAAALCYTSGTTGKPKGVLYSHRAIVLHTLVQVSPDIVNLSQRDVVMPVVPMFHVNAWGIPFACTMVGAKQVFPGPHLDAASVLDLIQRERVTMSAGVPTVWLGVLEALAKEPGRWDVSSVREVMVGGSAAPLSMIEAFDRAGVRFLHGWGMTEMSPIGSVSRTRREHDSLPREEQLKVLARQGMPLPFVEMKVVSENGPVPWDGATMGELHVRGPWIARSYFNTPPQPDKFTDDGWLRTGDIVTVDPEGYVRITDRAKDLIKSGGEWISSVDLENAIMGHPAVKEAAVVAVKHPKWDERPVAGVVLKEGARATEDELRAYLEPLFAKWWLPDAFVFLDAIPRTATGKFLKTALRDQINGMFEGWDGERRRATGAGPGPAAAAP